MKLEIEITNQVVIDMLKSLQEWTKLDINTLINQAIVSGLKAFCTEYHFNQARKINNETTTKDLQ